MKTLKQHIKEKLEVYRNTLNTDRFTELFADLVIQEFKEWLEQKPTRAIIYVDNGAFAIHLISKKELLEDLEH